MRRQLFVSAKSPDSHLKCKTNYSLWTFADATGTSASLMPLLTLSKRFGIVVRQRRVAAGLSQENLAERAGLHPVYVGMVERGLRNPTLDVSARIAKALKLSLPKLIEEAQQLRSAKPKKEIAQPEEER